MQDLYLFSRFSLPDLRRVEQGTPMQKLGDIKSLTYRN